MKEFGLKTTQRGSTVLFERAKQSGRLPFEPAQQGAAWHRGRRQNLVNIAEAVKGNRISGTTKTRINTDLDELRGTGTKYNVEMKSAEEHSMLELVRKQETKTLSQDELKTLQNLLKKSRGGTYQKLGPNYFVSGQSSR